MSFHNSTSNQFRLLAKCKPLFIGLISVLLVIFPPLISAGPRPASGITIYFYSPETNINNFSSLKVEFDTYLSEFGAYDFQPFSDQQTFERVISEANDGIFLISSWHFQSLKNRFPLKPMLVGEQKNQSTQKQVLSARSDIQNLERLRGQKIASAGSPEYTKTILKKMFQEEASSSLIDSLKLLTVPKDIDALMAVGFGMAKAALTTKNSLNKLKKINPKQHDMLTCLAMSEKTLLPIVAVLGQSDKDVRKLLTLIQDMCNKPEGEKRLKMLGLDGLKELDEMEIGMLNK